MQVKIDWRRVWKEVEKQTVAHTWWDYLTKTQEECIQHLVRKHLSVKGKKR